ncbi:MAG: bifunctional folylpolyglutamate synthase/dihydrofolate synthase [Bacteroidetes bacterium]|nr:bifunctional folylpolyglutamate synthase/dihydrofolate synthase [Bacteroidota bacterium]MBP7398076.1 bifunctional folylpolyglutamate synthase/dihydrofolate synthase [Chitinophagales bacterium]MBK8487933.1 bifunctional folylpolyglutamate synthase/dihydrofolate synthase [Bacteroidota bacterium]MBK8682312.1 bifunctional folylpolyglutamate synthase/dihydrofolate synthase [Bacteroidota bacterium]MBP8753166.1 bifunctional folylpolyglutamate synthase/dihydrofolate synthase [Chitinophagales bacteriu
MQYQETIKYLMEHLPMYQRIGAQAYKKDLTNITVLCNALGNPQNKFSTIHVAGTNGKGSVSNLLASVLFESGYKTGLYTSPHLLDFRERIRVNGEFCTREFVIGFTKNILPLIEEIKPSFFEITVAMAFEYFALMEVDVGVIEVGLGGRLDSTNIIQPDLSVITNIGYDHQQFLGETLPEIAFEKAGIIKAGKPVVIGEYHPETFPVFKDKALSTLSPLSLAEENIQIDFLENTSNGMRLNILYQNQLVYPNIISALMGNYQLKNIATVIESIEILNNSSYTITEDAVYDGFKNVLINTNFTGRFQKLSDAPLTYCDCAHNAEGLQMLFDTIQQLSFEQLHIITGAVNDKDLNRNLACFPKSAIYYFSKPDIPRGLPADKLKSLASSFELSGSTYDSVADAYYTAKSNAGSNDLILICGSIFVVSEVLKIFQNIDN